MPNRDFNPVRRGRPIITRKIALDLTGRNSFCMFLSTTGCFPPANGVFTVTLCSGADFICSYCGVYLPVFPVDCTFRPSRCAIISAELIPPPSPDQA